MLIGLSGSVPHVRGDGSMRVVELVTTSDCLPRVGMTPPGTHAGRASPHGRQLASGGVCDAESAVLSPVGSPWRAEAEIFCMSESVEVLENSFAWP